MRQRVTKQDLIGVIVSDGYEVASGLGVDRESIPADGATAAAFHYQRVRDDETAVVFTVNGVAQPAQALDAEGCAEIEVTSVTPGTLEVSVPGFTLTVQVL